MKHFSHKMLLTSFMLLFVLCLAVISTIAQEQTTTQETRRVLTNEDFQQIRKPETISNKDIPRVAMPVSQTNQIRPKHVNSTVSNSNKKAQPSLKQLLGRKELLETRITLLVSQLNKVQTRVLQNRPINPMTVGDPYDVDPKLRLEGDRLKNQLQQAQTELKEVTNKLQLASPPE
jgi:hypothetical protein